MRINRRIFEYQPQGVARAVAWLLVLAFCTLAVLAEYVSGPNLDFGSIYLIPCVVSGWYLGRRAGIATVLLCAAAWFVTSSVPGSPGTFATTLVNTVSRFSVFLLLVVVLDVLRRLVRQLSDSALTDTLTRLGNRRAFRDQGQRGIDAASRAGLPVSLLYIDLDRFKEVNDTRGHAAGDQVLRDVADALRAGTRRTDLAARLGGDEFGVLLFGSGAEAALQVAEKLRDRLAPQFERSGLPVALSIGIATAPLAQTSLEAMLKESDAVMYEAKEKGDGAIVQRTLSEVGAPGRAAMPS
jgi:diguanylate cyclase (GGDEF)-like protein